MPSSLTRALLAATAATAATLALLPTGPAAAAPAIGAVIQVSSDTFTDTDAQHATEVEPDTFAAGHTIVSASRSGGSSAAAPPIWAGPPPPTAAPRGSTARCPA